MNKESIQKIARHYGYDAQSRQCIEEMAELTVAINKYYRAMTDFRKSVNPPPPKKPIPIKEHANIVEEIADVQIMLWQLEYLLNADVEPIIEQKISRQLERIEREVIV